MHRRRHCRKPRTPKLPGWPTPEITLRRRSIQIRVSPNSDRYPEIANVVTIETVSGRALSAKFPVPFWAACYKISSMRRGLAINLVGLFSFLLISPAFSAPAPDANLPACCRLAGKHRCSLRTQQETSGAAFRSGACPLYRTQIGPAASAGNALQTETGAANPLIPTPANFLQPQSRSHSSYHRTGQTRGPPALI